MKQTIPALIIFILSTFAYSQSKRLENVEEIVHAGARNSIYLMHITVTPQEYILELRLNSYYFKRNDTYIEEITTGKHRDDLIPVTKITGLTLGKKYRQSELNFKVYLSRKYTTIFFENISSFGSKAWLDVSQYGEYVDKRLKIKGIADNENPKVYLNYPKLTNNFFKTEELFVTLEGRVTDNLGVLALEMNEQKISFDDKGDYKKRLKLKLGQNTVVFKATDINNNITTYDFMIIRDEIIESTDFSDVDFPVETSTVNRNAIAVVFGIEDYRNAPSVSFAVNDADIFREYLIKRFGISRENIYLRLDEQATKGELDKVFSPNGWIARHSSDNSDVIIYYAGHGAPDLQTKENYLIPYDGDPNYSSSTGYPVNEIYSNLAGIKAKSITIIIDACFSGLSRDNQPLLADARSVFIKIKHGAIPANMSVFSAASGSEISSAYKEKKHGIFTYFLLKGLSGEGDLDKDKKITVTEMQNYLSENVSLQARRMGREQHPQLLGAQTKRVLLEY